MSGKPYNLQKTLPFTTNEQDSKLSLKFPISREKCKNDNIWGKCPAVATLMLRIKRVRFAATTARYHENLDYLPSLPSCLPRLTTSRHSFHHSFISFSKYIRKMTTSQFHLNHFNIPPDLALDCQPWIHKGFFRDLLFL